MKTTYFLSFITLFSLTLWSCNTDQQVVPDDVTLSSARLAGDTTGFHCRSKIIKIAVADLPATITAAISASYAGATLDYAAKDDAGNFLVAITRNSMRTTLLFNPNGTFNRELAFRGKPGDGKPGNGNSGRDRDSLVAVGSLPAAITNYIKTNHAGATINVAAIDAKRGYIVMITLANNTRKALIFNLDGTFAQEVVRDVKPRYNVVDAATLPAIAKTYITTNYAGAVIRLVGKSPTGEFKVFLQLTNGQIAELTFAPNGTFVQGKKGPR